MSAPIESKRVMIIEDNQLNQKIADMIIKQLGHETIQVFEGVGAFERIKAEKPDLIILDIKMPDSSGVDICRDVKNDPELKDIPVIVVTALASEEEKKEIVSESKCNEYIAKPFLPNIFATTIGRFIEIRSVDWGL
ncbi:MAG: two-component system cell cycle response regulator DivK [Rickettsiales bacterium]|jgi:two-component system cell cycle response regulator DivK